MPYKTILTYLPNTKSASQVLEAVLPVAKEHDAHLIGLHVIPRVPVTFVVAAVEIPQSVIQKQEEMLEREAEALKEHFEKLCRQADVKFEWRCNKIEHQDMATEVASQALCCDLIAVTQSEVDEFGFHTDIPSHIVTETGRPVLIVPRSGAYPNIGTRAVIAWNASKEAARATFDALPFLQRAEIVKVLAIDPECRSGYDSVALGDDLAVCLARRNVKAETEVVSSGPASVSDELLQKLVDDGCDLLVMGCYGHSRLRETLFGGVTRILLDKMTVPVLMSH